MTVFFLVSVLWVRAQSNELIIQGQTGNLYLEHAVAAKETWYSIGRLYNVDPRALAQFNHLTFAKPLAVAEVLKVPLSGVNFSQDGKKVANETLVAVYHVVQEKEWLYRISVNHNKVPIPVLEKWNHITGDQVHVGLAVIVGYLKVKTALSALAKVGVVPGAGVSGAAGLRVPGAGGSKGVKASAGSDSSGARDGAQDTTVVQAPVVQTPVVQTPVVKSKLIADVSAPHYNGGKFKGEYSDGGKSMSGQAGIFKSASGWQDGKYYALINNVAVGTIVKVTDQGTGKSVYAKVLGQLPEMKESAGLAIRLSNAAAAELGEGDARFGVGVSY
jgi:LysM repeat protein